MTTAAKVTHSALPWRIEKDGGDTHVRDANGNSMACDMSYYPWTFDIDDAEFIVRAVNSHADMLEALEALPLTAFDKDPATLDAAEFVDASAEFLNAMAKARAAIQKAKGSAA